MFFFVLGLITSKNLRGSATVELGTPFCVASVGWSIIHHLHIYFLQQRPLEEIRPYQATRLIRGKGVTWEAF